MDLYRDLEVILRRSRKDCEYYNRKILKLKQAILKANKIINYNNLLILHRPLSLSTPSQIKKFKETPGFLLQTKPNINKNETKLIRYPIEAKSFLGYKGADIEASPSIGYYNSNTTRNFIINAAKNNANPNISTLIQTADRNVWVANLNVIFSEGIISQHCKIIKPILSYRLINEQVGGCRYSRAIVECDPRLIDVLGFTLPDFLDDFKIACTTPELQKSIDQIEDYFSESLNKPAYVFKANTYRNKIPLWVQVTKLPGNIHDCLIIPHLKK